MTTAQRIEVTAPEGPASLTIHLVGQEYLGRPPKAFLAIKLSSRMRDAGDDADKLLAEVEAYVRLLLGAKQAEAVMARLGDPEDQLDFPHIVEVMNKVTEAATGNPTT